jgi:hypothetical protein
VPDGTQRKGRWERKRLISKKSALLAPFAVNQNNFGRKKEI